MVLSCRPGSSARWRGWPLDIDRVGYSGWACPPPAAGRAFRSRGSGISRAGGASRPAGTPPRREVPDAVVLGLQHFVIGLVDRHLQSMCDEYQCLICRANVSFKELVWSIAICPQLCVCARACIRACVLFKMSRKQKSRSDRGLRTGTAAQNSAPQRSRILEAVPTHECMKEQTKRLRKSTPRSTRKTTRKSTNKKAREREREQS